MTKTAGCKAPGQTRTGRVKAGRAGLGVCLAAAMLLGTALAIPAGARAEEAVVVASTAPGYALGQVVADGSTVTVPEGAAAHFLFADGRMIRLEGPFEGRIDSVPQLAARGGADAAGDLVSGERFFQTDLGASRSVSPWPVRLETALAIDPGSTGTYCVPSDGQLRLRRPSDPALSAVTLRDRATGATARVSWPADGGGAEGDKGDGTVPWPRQIPVRDGAEIIVAGPDRKPRHALWLRLVDGGKGKAQRGPALAVSVARAGCRAQAEALLSSLRDQMAPLNLYLATDRGLYPTYRPGEPVRMVLQTNRDAHVYCYLRNRRGLTPIFPPGASASSRVEGHVPLSFPGERMPLSIQAGQPGSDQEVRCFAAGRDLDGELPGRQEAYRPLGPDALKRLDRALGALRGTDLVMAQVVLRVD